jgi:hypothetical protein
MTTARFHWMQGSLMASTSKNWLKMALLEDRQETFNSPLLFYICHQKFSILSLSFLPLSLFEFFLFFMCSTFFLVSLVMSFSFRVVGVSPGIMAESSHDCHQYIGECVKLTSTQLDSSYQQNLKHSPLRLEEIIFETE